MTTDPKDAEIARLKDRLAEEMKLYAKTAAERDAALAQVAGAYEAAAKICDGSAKYHMSDPDDIEAMMETAKEIRALAPTDALAARSRRDAQMRAEGMRRAAKLGNELPDAMWDKPWTEYEHGIDDLQTAIHAAVEKEAGNG